MSFWLTLSSLLVKLKEEHGCLFHQVTPPLQRSHQARTKPRALKEPFFTGLGKSRMSSSKIQRALSRVETTQIHSLRFNSGKTRVRTSIQSASNSAQRESRKFSNSLSKTNQPILDHSASSKKKFRLLELKPTRTINIFRLLLTFSTA